jgi:hypothetical protein
MMGGVSPETCWASDKYGIIKFWYIVASCWIFLYESYCMMHGSTNVKFTEHSANVIWVGHHNKHIKVELCNCSDIWDYINWGCGISSTLMLVPTAWRFRLLEMGSGICCIPSNITGLPLWFGRQEAICGTRKLGYIQSWRSKRRKETGRRGGGGGYMERMLQERGVSRRNGNIKWRRMWKVMCRAGDRNKCGECERSCAELEIETKVENVKGHVQSWISKQMWRMWKVMCRAGDRNKCGECERPCAELEIETSVENVKGHVHSWRSKQLWRMWKVMCRAGDRNECRECERSCAELEIETNVENVKGHVQSWRSKQMWRMWKVMCRAGDRNECKVTEIKRKKQKVWRTRTQRWNHRT